MGRQQRLKARRAIGAVVTRAGVDSVDLAVGQPGRAERTRAARERNAGHETSCTCNATPRADSWFRIRNFVDQPRRAAIYIYEEIGYWGCTALDFVQMLNQLDVDYLDVHINSPGGEVDDGIAIFNAIRQHKAYVTTYIDGLAASAASFIAMAGDKVCISEFGQVMIHDAMGLSFGNEAETIEFAAILGRYSNNIAGIYAAQSGSTVEQCRELMRAETWFTGPEAVEAGLCDEVHDLMAPDADEDETTEESVAARMTARWDLSLFSFRYKGRDAAPAPALTSQAEPVEPVAEVEPESPADVVEPEPVEDVTPADDSFVTPEESGSVNAETERSEPVAADDETPVAPVDPEPAEPAAVEPEAPAEADVFALSASALLSAIPAPPTPVDAFAALKEGLLS